jgi:hypothetical protein
MVTDGTTILMILVILLILLILLILILLLLQLLKQLPLLNHSMWEGMHYYIRNKR